MSRLAPLEPQALGYENAVRIARRVHVARGGAGGLLHYVLELLARTFALHVLACPKCQGRMKLLGLVKNPAIISRTLATVGEATEVPRRSHGRGPPYGRVACSARMRSGRRTAAGAAGGSRGGSVAAERQRGCTAGRSGLRAPRGRRDGRPLRGAGGRRCTVR